jgi:GntR family transcriptional regulator
MKYLSKGCALTMDKSIDFSSPIPYYLQLIQALKNKIQNGEWKTGDKLPGEFELCETYGVSRTVVRQALRELELDGLITRKKGKGTFISGPKINESLVQKLTGFFEDMVSRGHTPRSQVLHHDVIPAKAKIADFLQLEPSDLVHMIERLRSVDDYPIVLVTTYIPHALCPTLMKYDLNQDSLYTILENEFNLEISHGTRSVEAVAATEREAQLLNIPVGSPLILLNSVSYLADGTPLEYYHAVHRGDRSRFVVELVRKRDMTGVKGTVEATKLSRFD